MRPLLAILNPRHIPAAIESFKALNVDKAWLTGYTEREIAGVFPRLAEHPRFSHIIVISDDCVVSQPALDAVVRALTDNPVVTGYCHLDETDSRVNLSKRPLKGEPPTEQSYSFYDVKDLRDMTRTFFAGHCLTGMPMDYWQRFPFGCYGREGYGSDYHLSLRLQKASVPIVAPIQAKAQHLKAVWNEVDSTPGRGLLVGQVPPATRFELAHRYR